MSGVQERSLIVLIQLQGPSEEGAVEGHGVHVGYIFNRSLFWLLVQFNRSRRSELGRVNGKMIEWTTWC